MRVVDEVRCATLDALRTGHTEIADACWKEAGLFAVDSANTNSFDTGETQILRRTAADALLLQETKRFGDHASEQISRAGRKVNWNLSSSPALRTAENKGSGGCAVGCRRGTGITASEAQVSDAVRHRFHLAWSSAILKRGVHLGSVYLKDSSGLSDENLLVLQEIAVALKQTKGIWILGGDWNITPEVLLSSGWLQIVKGIIVAPSAPTCHQSVYDFFVVAEALSSSVVGVSRIDDGGLSPHWPVRLYLRGDGHRFMVRKLRRPQGIPGVLPAGPLPQSDRAAPAAPDSVDAVSIDTAMDNWIDGAYQEWSSLLGAPRAFFQPYFYWASPAGCTTDEHAGSCFTSASWRVIARRTGEAAAIIDRQCAGGLALVNRHFSKLYALAADPAWTAPEREEIRIFIHAIVHHASASDTIGMRRLTALAIQRAVKVERSVKARKASSWRQALAAPSAAGQAPLAAPSRLAFAWVRGSTGWSKSPVGAQALNDDVPDDTFDDGLPSQDLQDQQGTSRMWGARGRQPEAVLSDQADVELEANGWAHLWQEGSQYTGDCPPFGSEAMQPLYPIALRRSAASFPAGTGLGADNAAPRAISRLSDRLLKTLCIILMAAELLGQWPAALHLIVVVLIPKADGGRRPIGLFPAIIRVWARARSEVAKMWIAAHPQPGVYGGAGMGAQKAAWQVAFQAEAAAHSRQEFGHSLLDLVKAFEQVQHWTLVRAATKHHFNLWLLRMSLAAYRIKRTVSVDGCCSRCVVACCGITAGSVFATTELRLLFIDIINDTYRIWTGISISVYVDDATLAATGEGVYVAAMVSGATDHFVHHLEDVLQLEVSIAKSVTGASRYSIAELTASFTTTGKLKPVRAAKLLGAPSGGGKRRAVKVSWARVRKFGRRVRKIHVLRKLSINTRIVVRAAGTPAITYGCEISGMSDSHLSAARTAIATAIAPASGGKNAEMVLFAMDANGSTVDPAYDAHVLPIRAWSLAHWERWQPQQALEQSFEHEVARLRAAKRTPWDLVTGPVGTFVASVWRLGWHFLGPTTCRTADGLEVNFVLDSPASITATARHAVRRWQLACASRLLPAMIPDGDDLGGPLVDHDLRGPARLRPPAPYTLCDATARLPPSVINVAHVVGRLTAVRTRRSKVYPLWAQEHKPYLISTLSGGQWTQSRVAQAAGDGTTDLCQLCHLAPGTLDHRRCCEATRPEGGWPRPPAECARICDRLGSTRRRLLQAQGLFTIRIKLTHPRPQGWFRWLLEPPECLPDDVRWYVDGSMIDNFCRPMIRTGFGIAVVSAEGQLLAYAFGSPPAWAQTANAAEAWAFYQVCRQNARPPITITDCLSVPDTLLRGREAATASNMHMARIWNLIAGCLDGEVWSNLAHRTVIWMPAHGSRASVNRAVKSNGCPVSWVDWRSNRLVDSLAKAAAHRWAVPESTKQFVRDAIRLYEFSAGLVGNAAFASNHYQHTDFTDNGVVTRYLRDSQPPPVRRQAPAQAAGPGTAAASAPPTATAPASASSSSTAAPPHRRPLGTRHLEAERDARFLHTWHQEMATQTRAPREGPTAAERLAALRLRVLRKHTQGMP